MTPCRPSEGKTYDSIGFPHWVMHKYAFLAEVSLGCWRILSSCIYIAHQPNRNGMTMTALLTSASIKALIKKSCIHHSSGYYAGFCFHFILFLHFKVFLSFWFQEAVFINLFLKNIKSSPLWNGFLTLSVLLSRIWWGLLYWNYQSDIWWNHSYKECWEGS